MTTEVETWHRLFLRQEKQEIARERLGLDGQFAPLVHTHVPDDVTGLDALLAAKANVAHTHAIADIVGLQALLDLIFAAVPGFDFPFDGGFS